MDEGSVAAEAEIPAGQVLVDLGVASPSFWLRAAARIRGLRCQTSDDPRAAGVLRLRLTDFDFVLTGSRR